MASTEFITCIFMYEIPCRLNMYVFAQCMQMY